MKSRPETIEAVIAILIAELPLKDKTRIAKLKEDELIYLTPALGAFIRDKFLWNGNEPLMIDLMHRSGRDALDEDGASALIIQALWEELKKTHKLRVVK